MTNRTLEEARLDGGVAVDALVGEVANWEGVELATKPRFGGPMSRSAAVSWDICTTRARAAPSPIYRYRAPFVTG